MKRRKLLCFSAQQLFLIKTTPVCIKLNCTITAETYDNSPTTIITAAVGGLKVADFINMHQMTWIPLSIMGGIRPLDEMVDAGLDLYNENNFNQVYTKMSEINGHTWGLNMTGKAGFARCTAFFCGIL